MPLQLVSIIRICSSSNNLSLIILKEQNASLSPAISSDPDGGKCQVKSAVINKPTLQVKPHFQSEQAVRILR